MKILQINTVYAEGSTGKIVKDIHDRCVEYGLECLSAFRCEEKGKEKYEDTIAVSTWIDSRIHGRLARYTMFKGFFSVRKTALFIKKIKEYSPDIVHIHNLHGSYINIPLLFRFLKKHKISIVWTLHDCWAFTGNCSHFTIAQCDRWKSGCSHCIQKKESTSSPVDFSNLIWQLKNKMFTQVNNVTIITPSHWLESLVKESFLNEYAVQTIYNGIDLDIFKPIKSNFREKYNLDRKKVVLGVAFGWGFSKGLDVFLELAKFLSDDYAIVLVGTNKEVEKKLPQNIISIHRTCNQRELAEIYTEADVFVNPTREEVLGLVNLEALACGTPVITFNTGGSPECIDSMCGSVIECNDVVAMKEEIIRVCMEHPYSSEACINRAKFFDKKDRLEEYIKLYEATKL